MRLFQAFSLLMITIDMTAYAIRIAASFTTVRYNVQRCIFVAEGTVRGVQATPKGDPSEKMTEHCRLCQGEHMAASTNSKQPIATHESTVCYPIGGAEMKALIIFTGTRPIAREDIKCLIAHLQLTMDSYPSKKDLVIPLVPLDEWS
jgi:hypothetical protein